MLKKTLINNAIALFAYGLSTAAAWVCLYAFSRIINSFMVIGCIAAFLYVLCGFFLRPVTKLSFLSVVSIAIALIILLNIAVRLGERGLDYYFLNPIAISLLELEFDFLMSNQHAVVLLSSAFPSLLFYLGMILRRLTVARRRSRYSE